jgi:hypothetical protein
MARRIARAHRLEGPFGRELDDPDGPRVHALVLPVVPSALVLSSLGDCRIHFRLQPTVDCALGQRLVGRA